MARCGIDLGTTYSAISWYDRYNNRVDTMDLNMLADGQRTARSVVYYPGSGQEPVIGETAWNAYRQYPDQVAVGIKRSMGTDYRFKPFDGEEFTPQQVSAEILKALVKDARTALGEDVTEAVITVPAHFGDNERAATEEAGRLAGLKVLALLPEPHAAALAYCIEKATEITDKYLLVYDLGGGTFDVTLIHATTASNAPNALNLKINTLCKRGNCMRGGLDWDRALADIVAEKIAQADGTDVRQDPKNEAALMDNCEKGKRQLGRLSSTSILGDMGQHQVEVTRVEFEARTAAFLLETKMLMEQVLDEAEKGIMDENGKKHEIPKEKIQILISGGASKMPMVKEMLRTVTNVPLLEHGNPELLVTIGAAYWAFLLGDQDGNQAAPTAPRTIPIPVPSDDGKSTQTKDLTVERPIDIAAYTVGVEVMRPDGQGNMKPSYCVVVEKNSSSGQKFEKVLYKTQRGMKEISIVIYKSDEPTDNLDQCTELGTFVLSGLPDGGEKGEEVLVRMWHDDNLIFLKGEAIDKKTGQKVDIEIKRRQD